MATPLIRINQTGQPAGTPGESRDNIVIGSELQVTDTANGGGSWSWTVVLPPDSAAVPTGLGTNDVRVTPDVAGTYLFFVVHDGTEYSYTINAVGEWESSQGGAAVLLPDGSRIPGEGETDQFDGWAAAMQSSRKKLIRLREDGNQVNGGPFSELNFTTVGGGDVTVAATSSGTATVTISGGGAAAAALQTTSPTEAAWQDDDDISDVANHLGTTGANVTISGAAPPTVGQALVATSATEAEWTDVAAGSADALTTTSGIVTISGSNPPTVGQALVAVSDTEAIWQDVSTSGGEVTSAQGDYLQVVLGTNMSATLSLPQRVLFDTVSTNRGDLSLDVTTNVGRVSGLKAGRTYLMTAVVHGQGSGHHNVFSWYNVTADAALDGEALAIDKKNNLSVNTSTPVATHVFTPTVDTEVEVRITGVDDTTDDILADRTWATVVEIGAVQANVVGGLEYMDTISVTAATASVTFGAGGDGLLGRALDGDVDSEYIIIHRIKKTSTVTTVDMKPNGLGTNQVSKRTTVQSSTGTFPRLVICQPPSTGFELGETTFDVTTGRERSYHTEASHQGADPASEANSWSRLYTGTWDETSTNVTSIEFATDDASAGIDAGSEFVLYRRTRTNLRADSAATYERNVETAVSQGTAAAVTFTTGSANFGGSAVGVSATLIEDSVTSGSITVDFKIAGSTILTATLNSTNSSYARAAAPLGTYPVSAGDTIEVDVTTSSLVTTGAGTPGLVINTTLTNDAFIQPPRTSYDYLYAGLSADQTTNISEDNHIEFDTSSVVGTSISLATGAGQANGLFTLTGGKLYEVYAHLNPLVNEGQCLVQWLDSSDDSTINDVLGIEMGPFRMMDQYGTDNVEIPTQTFLYQPVSDITIKLDVIASPAGPAAGGLQRWYSGSTRVWIKEVV
jgi:hypothetical protein